MRDPRCRLTAQELIYAATALRAQARRAAQQAMDPQYQCSQAIFESAAKAYADLAEAHPYRWTDHIFGVTDSNRPCATSDRSRPIAAGQTNEGTTSRIRVKRSFE